PSFTRRSRRSCPPSPALQSAMRPHVIARRTIRRTKARFHPNCERQAVPILPKEADMTMALCVKCGAMKHGAFTPCSECRAIPDTEIDIAYTLLFSDHHFEESVLHEISQG